MRPFRRHVRHPSEADTPTESFGPYDVYEELGAGGMAKVHRAKKRGIEGFQRPVALKRLLEPLADDEKFIKSFVREARLASYLHHANIIQIYDLGRVDKVYFIAMELVQGWDLRQILKQSAYATGPMPVSVMLYLTRQLCDALHYAHDLTDEAGEPLRLVHRDISPANLLVAAAGHLKIIDFGIAKAAPSSLHTQSGRLKGKFSYMAPEVIRGRSFDHRSDLFAVGIVAYELLTARPLFAAKNEYDTLRSITKLEVPPPSTLNPDCPPELDEVVLKALAKKPVSRWRSAGEMLSALDRVAKSGPLQATNRDVAEWVAWAFEQPLKPHRVSHPSLSRRASTTSAPKRIPPKPQPPKDLPRSDEAANIEQVWGEKLAARGRLSQQLTAQIACAYAEEEPVTRQSLPEFQFSDYSGDTAAISEVSLPRGLSSSQSGRVSSEAETIPRDTGSNPSIKSKKLATLIGVAPPPALSSPGIPVNSLASKTLVDGDMSSDSFDTSLNESFDDEMEFDETLPDDMVNVDDILSDSSYDSMLDMSSSASDAGSSVLPTQSRAGTHDVGETGAVRSISETHDNQDSAAESRSRGTPLYIALALFLGVATAAAVYFALTGL